MSYSIQCLQLMPPDWVLILGDGNLSFSRAFALVYPHCRLTATVLEPTIEEHNKRYPLAAQIVQELLEMTPRVRVVFGVDATQLTKDFTHNFRIVIMNFPHPGGKSNTKESRDLLSRLFKGVSLILRQKTEFRLTLTARQAGLNLGDDLKRYCIVTNKSLHAISYS